MKNKFTLSGIRNRMMILFAMMMPVSIIFGQTAHHVEVSSNKYTPADLTIAAGDTVIWTNVQGNHNVNGMKSVFPNNPESFGNNVAGPGWTYSYVFTAPGTYDYQCDPHIAFNMFGKLTVEENTSSLTINFTGMNPHVGQTLWLTVFDEDAGKELARVSKVVEAAFSVVVDGITVGNDYTVDFFSDHNGNGYYDAPSTDHAWSLELKNVADNEVVDFSHNTDFTDIEWEHKAYVNLSGMNPHVGQEIYFALIDGSTGEIIDRISETVTESFMVELSEIIPGGSYYIDFFSDHNGNGYYDAPPADHAWRLEIEKALGDTTISFTHNTNFTDVMWKHRLEVKFMGMGPHVGQMLTLYVRDKNSGAYLDTVKLASIDKTDFNLKSYVIEPGKSYQVDFYADHNGNGSYDAPPTDHAWRMEVMDVRGDTELDFTHNTSFTDIFATTGLGNSIRANRVSVYPNPVTSLLHVSLDGDSDEAVIVSIYNLSGARLFDRSYGTVANSEFDIDLNYLESGVYLMKISSASFTEMVKVIKD